MLKYKIGLYIVSLTLLFISIIIKTYDFVGFEFCGSMDCLKFYFYSNIPTLVSIVFIILSFVTYNLFLKEIDGDFAHPKTIESIENISNNHLSFLATYILPFATFNFSNSRDWLVFIFMIIIIGVIYVKTNFFYTNPTLSLAGFYVYNVSFKGDETKIIAISKKKLNRGDVINRRLIDENIYFVKS